MKKLYARKCQLKEFKTRKEIALAKEFIRENHSQGLSRGSKAFFGLIHNEEIVMIMTFGNPRFNRNFQWELIRECSKKGLIVTGGSSRLWKAFKKVYQPLTVVVYTSIKDKHIHEYSDHYVKHLGFKRLATSRMKWTGKYKSKEWPRGDSYGQEYSESSIIHYGPDRMLGTTLLFDNGSNHEIMLNLGYELNRVKEPSPVVDYWTILEQDECPTLADNSNHQDQKIIEKSCNCGKFALLLSGEDSVELDEHVAKCKHHTAINERVVYQGQSEQEANELINKLKKIVYSSKVGSRRLLNRKAK